MKKQKLTLEEFCSLCHFALLVRRERFERLRRERGAEDGMRGRGLSTRSFKDQFGGAGHGTSRPQGVGEGGRRQRKTTNNRRHFRKKVGGGGGETKNLRLSPTSSCSASSSTSSAPGGASSSSAGFFSVAACLLADTFLRTLFFTMIESVEASAKVEWERGWMPVVARRCTAEVKQLAVLLVSTYCTCSSRSVVR